MAVQIVKRQRQRHLIFIRQHQQRPQIIIPAFHEGGYGQCGDGRAAQGKNDHPEDPEHPRAVDPGRFHKIIGYGSHLLHQHKNTEYPEKRRQNHTGVGIDQAELIHDHKQRDQRHLGRYHHGGQIQLQQAVRSGKPDFGKGKRRHGGRQNGNERIACGDEEAVENSPEKREF